MSLALKRTLPTLYKFFLKFVKIRAWISIIVGWKKIQFKFKNYFYDKYLEKLA